MAFVFENITKIIVGLFLASHLFFLAYKVARNGLKPLEFAMLFSLSILPTIFVFLDPLMTSVSKTLGVTYPFVLMFGLINFCFFVLVSIILDKVNKLNQDIADVAQHVGLQNPIRKYTEDTSNTPKSDG